MKIFSKNILLAAAAIFLSALLNAQEEDKFDKLVKVMGYVDAYYTDSIDTDKLIETAIENTFKELDPHSRYYTKEENEKISRRLRGSFNGIGITYTMLRDTMYIISVVEDGPSDKAGVRPGDRVISIEGENVTGISLKPKDIHERVKGKKGTKIKLTVKRRNEKNPTSITITRDKITMSCIDAVYMAAEGIGYLKLNKFAANAGAKTSKAIKKLKKDGAEHIILDLRGNTGGYLNSAVKVSELFLDKNKLIVYTSGKNSPKNEYISGEKALFAEGRVAVLVDKRSASASEIVSGALQDWDRAVIIGQKTYGKGLVQRPFYLNDGSMVRITIARYFTPSGRSIQKPYDVNEELIKKQIKNNTDSLNFKTSTKKRSIASGGGILPDEIIIPDSTRFPLFYQSCLRAGKAHEFVHHYVDINRVWFKTIFPTFKKYREEFSPDIELIRALGDYTIGEIEFDDKIDAEELVNDKEMKLHLKALIAADLWGRQEYTEIINEISPSYLKAIEILQNPKTYTAFFVEE